MTSYKLDLHGIRHEDVERLVENFALLTKPPLKIITGNSERMQNLVEDVLITHRFGYEKLPGRIKVF